MDEERRKHLVDIWEEVLDAIEERKAVGEFDANSKHVLLLLYGMAAMIDNAIKKPEKK